MKYVFITLAIALSGCQGQQGDPGPQGPPAAPSGPSDVQAVVDEYNAYRESLGQDPLTQGLSCNLYTIPTTTTQIVGATLTNVGSFEYNGNFNVQNSSVTAGFPVLPTALQPVYQSWFIVKCTGDLVVTESGWYEFDTSSDDGANLYVDGQLVVNNDGLHGIQQKIGTKFLQENVHSFELDFLQANGNQALIVNMNSALLPAANLYH